MCWFRFCFILYSHENFLWNYGNSIENMFWLKNRIFLIRWKKSEDGTVNGGWVSREIMEWKISYTRLLFPFLQFLLKLVIIPVILTLIYFLLCLCVSRKPELHRKKCKWTNFNGSGLSTRKRSSVCLIIRKLYKPINCLTNWRKTTCCFFCTLLSKASCCNSGWCNWWISGCYKCYILMSGTPTSIRRKRATC